MIIEALVKVIAGLLSFVAGLFPKIEAPGWLTSFEGWLGTLAGHAAGLGHWVPFDRAVQAGGFVLACLGVAFVIRMIRLVLSLFTGGGGSAA